MLTMLIGLLSAKYTLYSIGYNEKADFNFIATLMTLLTAFTITCGIIIVICICFEKQINGENISESSTASYFDRWCPCIFSIILYAAVTIIFLVHFSNAMDAGNDFMPYFYKYGIFIVPIDILITILMRYKLNTDIIHSIIETIHFETRCMLMIVWLLVLLVISFYILAVVVAIFFLIANSFFSDD